MRSAYSSKWLEVMQDEMRSTSTNGVWDLEKISKGAKTVGCKWVYKTKYDSKGNVERFKARLVTKGSMQREGIYYNEIFSPTLCKDSFRIVMALVDASREIVYRSHRHCCGRGQGRDRPHRSGERRGGCYNSCGGGDGRSGSRLGSWHLRYQMLWQLDVLGRRFERETGEREWSSGEAAAPCSPSPTKRGAREIGLNLQLVLIKPKC
jgi:hypothetical protein